MSARNSDLHKFEDQQVSGQKVDDSEATTKDDLYDKVAEAIKEGEPKRDNAKKTVGIKKVRRKKVFKKS